jgi:hypothetical protein
MGEFDDVIRDGEPPSSEPEVQKDDTQPKLDKKSLVEMLTEDGDLNEFGKQLNLDSDMTEKVLVPLVNFLDKYGVGETLSTNPTINSGVNLVGFVSDVAPILRSASEYFQGKKTELSNEDEAFLERIKEAQNFDSMSLFVGESVEEEEEVEAEEVVEAAPPKNPFTEGVDWNQMLGATPNTSSQYGSIAESAPTTTGIITMESLAAESGLTMNQIQNDRQSATNSGSSGGSNVDYTKSDGLGDMVMGGMSEIQAAMKSEQSKITAQSKVIFEGESLATPDAISDYQPNTTPTPAQPTVGGLESLEDMMARQGIESFDSPPAEEEEIEIFEEEEMEYISETDSYRNKTTGEEYEAVSLTDIPDEYIELPAIGNDPIDVDELPPTDWLTDTSEVESVDEVIEEEPFFEIQDLTVAGLKTELRKLGLSTQGRKADLLNRLTETNNSLEEDTWDNEGGAIVEADYSEE